MIVGDYLIQQALQSGFLLLNSNTNNAIEDCLRSLALSNTQKYQEAVQWFTSNQPQVILGWPMGAPGKLPIVAVTLRSDAETDDFIGSFLNEQDYIADDGTHVSEDEENGFWTTATFDCTVYSNNANLSIWVSLAVRWALLAFRPALNSTGLLEQRISVGDWTPFEAVEDQFVYRRTVSLSGKYPAVVTTTYNTFITKINVFPDDPLSPEDPIF